MMNERKQKGLCFWCGAKYFARHKCVKSKLYQVLLEAQSDGEGEEFQECVENIEDLALEESTTPQPQKPVVSLHSIKRSQGPHTIRFEASIGSVKAIVLVDSRSTHNFLDTKMVNQLALLVCSQEKIKVAVANGRSILIVGVCKNVSWKAQGLKFLADFMLLPLKGCGIVLGIQWLLTIGSITWNFNSLMMQFTQEEELCTLKGIQPGSIQVMSASQFMKGFPLANYLLCPCTMLMVPTTQLTATTSHKYIPQSLQNLLQEFDDIFRDPIGLPPASLHNHKILLQDEKVAVKIRPYRYPTMQKNEIERIVQEMLYNGVIRDSTNFFASLIVMVKKKDGSWRLCMDYRQLNQLTIKDRFSIPMVEELLDELCHVSVFIKLNLRSGYHQVRITMGTSTRRNTRGILRVPCDAFWPYICSLYFPGPYEFYF